MTFLLTSNREKTYLEDVMSRAYRSPWLDFALTKPVCFYFCHDYVVKSDHILVSTTVPWIWSQTDFFEALRRNGRVVVELSLARCFSGSRGRFVYKLACSVTSIDTEIYRIRRKLIKLMKSVVSLSYDFCVSYVSSDMCYERFYRWFCPWTVLFSVVVQLLRALGYSQFISG